MKKQHPQEKEELNQKIGQLFMEVDWLKKNLASSNTLAERKALVGRKPDIINSDQGSQFTSQAYLDLMQSHGVRISMDGKRRASDNARTERFFRSLE